MYVYFYSLHVSGSHAPITRRINCINTISGICHSVWMTVWCAGLVETLIQTCTPNGHLYRVTCTRCMDTTNSPDDGHMAARNMYRIEINVHEKKITTSWSFTKIIPRCMVNRTQKRYLKFLTKEAWSNLIIFHVSCVCSIAYNGSVWIKIIFDQFVPRTVPALRQNSPNFRIEDAE